MLRKSFVCLFLGVLSVTVCNGNKIPNPFEKAKMARYIIHNVDWVSIATISTLKTIKRYPFVNLQSVADGPLLNGTGIPYLIMTDLDLSGRDVNVDNRVTVLASLAEVEYCKSRKYDPEDPRCGKLMLSGRLVKIPAETEEYAFAHNALLIKHPDISIWEKVHSFYIAKVDIEQVCILDYFGGPSFVPVEKYLNASIDYYNKDEITIYRID